LSLDAIGDRAAAIGATPTPPDDKQAVRVDEIRALGLMVAGGPTLRMRVDALDQLRSRCEKVSRVGAKKNWGEHGGGDALDELRAEETALFELADEVLTGFKAQRRRVVGTVCGRFVVDAARRRVEAGSLEFHDLLVHTRRLLATRSDVRRRLHDRYRYLLLDEFQDTDPIQLEIAVRLTADPDDPLHDADWRRLVPIPGRLFIVGDPKQSIYRFRRADIAQYLRAADQIGATTSRLTANFRSSEPVIRWVNDVFGRLIEADGLAQPAYQALDVERPNDRELGGVTVLGADHHDPNSEKIDADELRRREAVDVVGAVQSALSDGWAVLDRHPGHDGDPITRPCRPSDICILLPARTSLPFLEDALRSAGVPYRAENSAVVYGASEVRDLLLAVRAADDTTDELAVVSALRSPLYGCSDVDLYDWAQRGGSFDLLGRRPDDVPDHIVRDGLDHLRSVHRRVPALSAADLLVAVAEERRMFDQALGRHDARDVWRRLRFVIDQARAWADAGGRGVRRYLAWARLQAAEGRVSESVLPEDDHDAIRVMTIHAAKGLEFPITVLTGTTARRNVQRGVRAVWDGDEWMLTGRADDGTFAEFAPVDEQMSDAERRRLLYVACTRAVDHLVVSLHRTKSLDELGALPGEKVPNCSHAELLVRHGALDESAGADRRTFDPLPPAPAPAESVPGDDLPLEQWRDDLAATFERASRRSAIAATRLADEVQMLRDREVGDDPGLDKHAVNIDLPPWQRGRYGTAVGRAVHGTLQFCDLADGRDIDPLARSQCAAEGVLGAHPTVAALARSALTAPIVRSVAAGADHRRELFIAAPVGDRLLEGYIDLLVRDRDGYVIVDYKTDQWSGPVQTAERVARYRTQLAAYGAALESALGEPVVRGVLVRCVAGADAEEIEIDDWRSAIDDVRRLVG
ncbi:MAG: UvrD-helicase domain-containing protein, partial [Actinomycetota bacterium]